MEIGMFERSYFFRVRCAPGLSLVKKNRMAWGMFSCLWLGGCVDTNESTLREATTAQVVPTDSRRASNQPDSEVVLVQATTAADSTTADSQTCAEVLDQKGLGVLVAPRAILVPERLVAYHDKDTAARLPYLHWKITRFVSFEGDVQPLVFSIDLSGFTLATYRGSANNQVKASTNTVQPPEGDVTDEGIALLFVPRDKFFLAFCRQI